MADKSSGSATRTATVYFSGWYSKDIISYNRINLRNLLVLDQDGLLVYANSDEKLIAKVPGRFSQRMMKETVKAHVELELRDLEPGLEIPLENVTLRESTEIEKMTSRAKFK